MNALIPAAAWASLGQSVFFWVTAVLMVGCAIGVAASKKAVRSAIAMVGLMLCLAALYVSLGAYFLGVVQVVVYTGAIMMLILFVIMMVGVVASDNYTETPRWTRIATWIGGALGVVILGGALLLSQLPQPVAQTASEESNPTQIALSLFQNHLFSLEFAGTLLIVAAIGAVSLTHSDRLTKLFKQRETVEAKMARYAQTGTHPGSLVAPGVYANSTAADVPAISGTTESGIESSVPRVLRIRDLDRSIGEVAPNAIVRINNDRDGDQRKGLQSVVASQSVPEAGTWGMPGGAAPEGLKQPPTVQVSAKEESE